MPEHDHAYKLLFSHREMVADLLRGFVREDWVGELDLDSLERVREIGVAPDLRERDDDLLWRVRLHRDGQETWLYVYLLLEFQATVDPFMAVRILVYVGLLWQDLIKAGAVKVGEPLPPVLPVVLYNGAGPWTAPTDLAGLTVADLPDQLRHWQPEARYLLLEERAYPRAELEGLHNLVAALFRLEQSRGPADIEQVVAALLQWLAAPAQDNLRRAFVTWLNRILIPTRAPGSHLPNVTELTELHAMLAERVKTWTEEWEQEGLEKGLERGRLEGERRVVARQLQLRFGPLPPWVEERLAKASEAELEGWAERVLTCDTLTAVFAPDDAGDPAG